MPDYALTPTVLPPLLALVATLLMLGHTLERARQPVHRAFLALLAANAFWLVCNVMTQLASAAPLKWFWGLVEFAGILVMPVAWVVLVERFLRSRPEPVPLPRLLALLAVPAAVLALMWTNDAHRLIWTYAGGLPEWSTVERQPLYWLGVVGYANALLLWGAWRLLPIWRSVRGADRSQITVMLLAVALPSVANTLYLLGVPIFPGANPTPITFAFCLIPVTWGMARYGLLRVAPLAHRRVVEQLADAVFVLDVRGRILEANLRAVRLAGRSAPQMRDLRLTDVFPSWPPLVEGAPSEWQLGDEVWEVQLSTVRGREGSRLGQAVVARNVTARAREYERVQRLAHEDALTGLGNRRAFEADLERELARAHRYSLGLGVVIVDLDGLKDVNDGRGHTYGDALLAAFGRAVASAFRPEDRAYRLGGDEFAVLLVHAVGGGEPAVQERLDRTVRAVRAQGFPEAGASVGVAYFPHDGAGEALLHLADARMYEDKTRRRSLRRPTAEP